MSQIIDIRKISNYTGRHVRLLSKADQLELWLVGKHLVAEGIVLKSELDTEVCCDTDQSQNTTMRILLIEDHHLDKMEELVNSVEATQITDMYNEALSLSLAPGDRLAATTFELAWWDAFILTE